MNNKVEITHKNPWVRLVIAFVLWLVSVILKWFVAIISLIFLPLYYILTIKWKTGRNKLEEFLYNNALSNDQHGNVANAVTLQFVFTKKGGEQFGNPDDTVSYVLARNKYQKKLTIFGKGLCWILDKIDPKNGGHMYKAIGSKIEADQEACLRISENKYYE